MNTENFQKGTPDEGRTFHAFQQTFGVIISLVLRLSAALGGLVTTPQIPNW